MGIKLRWKNFNYMFEIEHFKNCTEIFGCHVGWFLRVCVSYSKRPRLPAGLDLMVEPLDCSVMEPAETDRPYKVAMDHRPVLAASSQQAPRDCVSVTHWYQSLPRGVCIWREIDRCIRCPIAASFNALCCYIEQVSITGPGDAITIRITSLPSPQEDPIDHLHCHLHCHPHCHNRHHP